MTDEKKPPKTFTGLTSQLLIGGKKVGQVNSIPNSSYLLEYYMGSTALPLEEAGITSDIIIQSLRRDARRRYDLDIQNGVAKDEANERFYPYYRQLLAEQIDYIRRRAIEDGMNSSDPYLRELLNKLLTEMSAVDQHGKYARVPAAAPAKIRTEEEVFAESNSRLAKYREATRRRRHL